MNKYDNEKYNMVMFNDVYYKTCFYNPFFTLVNHLNENTHIAMIAEDIFFYDNRTDYRGLTLCVNCMSIDLDEICLRYGILLERIEDNVYFKVKEAISNNKSAIIKVDQYYLPFSSIFKKQHSEHYIAVCSFINGFYNVIDNQTTIGCYNTIISDYYLKLAICSNFLDFSMEDDYIVYKQYDTAKVNITYCKDIFFNKLKNNITKMIIGLDVLEKGIETYNEILFSEKFFFNALNDVNDLGHLLLYNKTYKLAEGYRNKNFFENAYFNIVLFNISEKWDLIKNILIKAHISKIYCLNNLEYVKKLLNEIYILESEYVSKIVKYI
ncbi:MAG: hypothetical protein PHV04_08530 [Clostridia bacterium]|jgi:hypothetical protein|nr:hypothetical protein [Clostridia bacterium]MDD3094156.1 hypothetical protein [Clostridia bacterium]